MSLFQWVRYTAVFIDSNGLICGQKVFRRSYGSKGLKDGTFEYDNGIYNIKSKAFRVQTSYKTHLFFDDDVFIYRYGNPDPLEFVGQGFAPIMDPEVYKSRLQNKLVVDLNKIAMGGPDLVSVLKWLALGVLAFLVIYYFVKKGQVSEASSVVSNSSSIVQNLTDIGSRRLQ